MKKKMDLHLKKNCDEPEVKGDKKPEDKEKKKFDPKKWNKR